MSKLKYSLRRSFNAYILLMHYQRTDPWVDSGQRVISQRLHKANLVYDNRWEHFISGCSCYPGEKEQRKIQEVCSFGTGDREIGFNKTSLLSFTSHLGKKVFGKNNGDSVSCNTEGWKGRAGTSAPSEARGQAGCLHCWCLVFLLIETELTAAFVSLVKS